MNRSSYVSIACGGLAWLLASCDGGSMPLTPEPVAATDRIAFGACGSGALAADCGLFLVNADGSPRLRRLAAHPSLVHLEPVWSPDGGRIAFSTVARCGVTELCSELFVVHADGAGLRRLAHRRSHGTVRTATMGLAWSPDGQRIVFGAYGSIFAADADGSDLTELASGHSPRWSPDGKRIAFLRGGLGFEDGAIFIMDSDGSNPRQLTEYLAFAPRWSPDGARIAFLGSSEALHVHTELSPGMEDRGFAGLHVMDSNGSTLRRLTDSPGYDGHASWSPDGGRIAFDMYRDGSVDIYLIDADGSDPVRLTDSAGYASAPTWSPDAARIAFRSGLASLLVVKVDGTGIVALAGGFGWLGRPAWSPAATGALARRHAAR